MKNQWRGYKYHSKLRLITKSRPVKRGRWYKAIKKEEEQTKTTAEIPQTYNQRDK